MLLWISLLKLNGYKGRHECVTVPNIYATCTPQRFHIDVIVDVCIDADIASSAIIAPCTLPLFATCSFWVQHSNATLPLFAPYTLPLFATCSFWVQHSNARQGVDELTVCSQLLHQHLC